MDVVYFKLKSAKDFRRVSVDGSFISVPELKAKIVQSACYGHGKDFDLLMSDAITNRDYDERALIPRGSSVLIRRVPGWPQKTIVVSNSTEKKVEDAPPVTNPVVAEKHEEPDFHDFGPDLLLESKEPCVSKCGTETTPMEKFDEDAKIKLLVNTPALEGYHCGGLVSTKAIGGRSWHGKGCRVLEPKIPPQGYVCHRCQEPGHFIQHCPTNGDRNYDIKLKAITGIPKSMLVASSNGLYKLPNGMTADFKPNESDFDKEMEGISSRTHVNDLPPELYCPLCKKVMKDAVLSSKCCFGSFCDKCIRDHIISKSMCYCGTKNVLADDLIPNKTLRETLHAMLITKSTSSSSSREGLSSITYGGSTTNHNPPSAACTATYESQQGASSIEDSLVVKKDEGKIEVPPNNAVTKSSSENNTKERRKKLRHPNNTVTKSSLENNTKEKRKKLQQQTFAVESRLEESNSSEVVHGAVIDGNKKRKNNAVLPDTASSLCTTTCDPGMEYYSQFPFVPAPYNACWSAAPRSLGFDGYASYFPGGMPGTNYASYFPGGMPGMNYASGFYDTALCGNPSQPVYGLESHNFAPYRVPQRDTTTRKEMRSFKDGPLKKSKNELKATVCDDDSGAAGKLTSSYGHGHGRS